MNVNLSYLLNHQMLFLSEILERFLKINLNLTVLAYLKPLRHIVVSSQGVSSLGVYSTRKILVWYGQ